MISKEFLKSLFNKNKTVIILIFVVQMFLVYISMNTKVHIASDYMKQTKFSLFSYVLLFASSLTLIPLNFGFLKNKKAINTFFALPITRKKMANTLILFTFLEILIFCSPLFLECFKFIFAHEMFLLSRFLVFVFLLPISLFAFILPFIFLFNRCNHIIDGILVVLGHLAIPYLLILVIISMLGNFVLNFDYSYVVESIFKTGILMLINLVYIFTVELNNIRSILYYLFMLVAFGIVFYILFIIDFQNTKAENAEQISKDILTYPLLINLTTITLFLQLGSGYSVIFGAKDMLFMLILIFMFFAISNFIFKRKIIINFKTILNFVILGLISFLILLTVINTKAFRIGYLYPKEKNIVFRYANGENYISCNLKLNDEIKKEIKSIYDEENDYFYERGFPYRYGYASYSEYNENLDISYYSDDNVYVRSMKFNDLKSNKTLKLVEKIINSDFKKDCSVGVYGKVGSIDYQKNPKEFEKNVKKYFNVK